MQVFDTLSQLWVEKETKDLTVGDMVKHDNEQVSIVDRIDINSKNTIIVYLKPYLKGD